MDPVNRLPVPEVACHSFIEQDGVQFVSYAVRQPGEVLWGAFATLVMDGFVLGEVEADAFDTDPRFAALDIRQTLLSGIRTDVLGHPGATAEQTWRRLHEQRVQP